MLSVCLSVRLSEPVDQTHTSHWSNNEQYIDDIWKTIQNNHVSRNSTLRNLLGDIDSYRQYPSIKDDQFNIMNF